MEQIIDDFKQLNFNECQKLVDTNEPDGIYWLGYCYEFGIGVEKDEKKAFTYYQKSADMDNSNGMYQVGHCYYLGIGVEIDKRKAFAYYLKSAEAGNSMGMRKAAICYYYGIGVEKNEDKFYKLIDKDPIGAYRDGRDAVDSSFGFRYFRCSSVFRHDARNSKYGKCAYCNEDNTQPAWCLSCDPDLTTRWTSGNKDIDNCMKTFQLRAYAYELVIEWIPFDKLSDVKEIGKGGFGSVYSATWPDGTRKIESFKKNDNEKDDNNDNDSDDNYFYKRSREPNKTVALKTLASSKENNFDFLKEFKSLMTCKFFYNKLSIYGITHNTVTKELLMVFQYADNGSLNKYLKKNFNKLTWQTKLQILKDVSEQLNTLHYANYIHSDFHSGNILQDQQTNETNENAQSYIADLGLSRKGNEYCSEGDVYGVMPYVAPEVLSGKEQFTKKADIYGFGVIMAEITTGKRPLDGCEFNLKLAVAICKGLRPKFAPGTPKCYVEFAKRCMDSDPQKRPNSWDIFKEINIWLNKIASSDDDEIKNQFLEADKVTKSLPIPKHPDEMYTSKIISTKLISNAIKDFSQADSAQLELDLSTY